MKLPPQPAVPRGRIAAVMRRLARAIDGLEEPAVEKIAEDQQEDPFPGPHRDDAFGADERRRHRTQHRRGSSPWRGHHGRCCELTPRQIERLIYPVSFYRNKAVHVLRTCEQIADAIRREGADHDGRSC